LEFLLTAVDFFLHLDKYLGKILETYQGWTYALVSLTIFAETGFVVTPFLPGDSLIFVLGTFAAADLLDVNLLFALLLTAGIAGNSLNYLIGSWVGPAVYQRDFRLLKRKYIDQTRHFFDKYGGKAIIVARFLPIVRTFAPFLAGVGKMNFGRYTLYNVIGSVGWVGIFLYGGYFFGNIPVVKKNLTVVIMIIVLASFLPSLFELIRHRLKSSREPQ
jgi:membrane-associated protein